MTGVQTCALPIYSIFKIRTKEEVQTMVLEAIDRASMLADAHIKQEMSKIMPSIPGMPNLGM